MNVLNRNKAQKGFTIIEVVLVLAIAGLIFLMVFIALPALQSSQRDTARKADVGSISSAITAYTGNNRGLLPTTQQLTGDENGKFDTDTGKFGGYATSVSNNTTEITVLAAATSVTVSQGQIKVYKGSKCASSSAASGETANQALEKGSARQFAIVTFLEAGSGTAYCQDS